MSIAFLAHPNLMTPLQSLFRWFAAGATPAGQAVRVASKVTVDAPDFEANFSDCSRTINLNRSQTGPLRASNLRASSNGLRTIRPAPRAVRVSRLAEEGHAPANVGRIVISGRMQDVCAELDRLVLREATLH